MAPRTADEKRWEAEEDLRTLVRAGEIKKDKKRMKRAMDLAKKQMKDLEEIKA